RLINLAEKRQMILSHIDEYYVGIIWEKDALYANTIPFKGRNKVIENMKKLLNGDDFEIVEDDDPLAPAILDVFLGRSKQLPDIQFSFSGYTPKEISVLKTVLRISYGEGLSYGEIAQVTGIPGAARFVGNVMAKNRTPLLIPCHRVIRSDGKPGHYGYGTELKVKLLRREGFSFK
ncbi:MAG: methylated-DNA--[protein]-cysteine S-methyltransferase, partial [Candidatus Hodarchaeota archaeon]